MEHRDKSVRAPKSSSSKPSSSVSFLPRENDLPSNVSKASKIDLVTLQGIIIRFYICLITSFI